MAAAEAPEFFGFYSPDLEGFSGIGHSIEDCLYRARWGMKEHVSTMRELNLPVPAGTSNPTVEIQSGSWERGVEICGFRPKAAASLVERAQSCPPAKKSKPRRPEFGIWLTRAGAGYFTTGRRTMFRYSIPVWSPCR